MNTTTITVPGYFISDWLPARESWEGDIERAESLGRPLPEAPVVLRVLALLDAAPTTKRGGTVVRVSDLGVDGLRWLRGEALYRWEFNGGNRNPYGCEEPDANARSAARRLMAACDQALEGVAV